MHSNTYDVRQLGLSVERESLSLEDEDERTTRANAVRQLSAAVREDARGKGVNSLPP